MDRIASYSHQRSIIEQALRVQSTMAEKTVQQSSGLKSTDYGGIADEARSVVNLESEMSRALSYVDIGETVSTRIQAMYDATTQITDVTSSARSLITSALSGDSVDSESLASQAQSMMEEIQSLLNTQVDGRYLFAGSRTDTAPVDINAATYSSASSSTDANTGYYQGDDTILSYTASDDQTISYGLTAASSGFEKILRALSIVANGGGTSDELQQAYDLATEAVDAQAVDLTKLSLSSQRCDDAVNSNIDFQLYLEGMVSNLKEVDVAAVTADLSALQAQLEASYSAVSTLSKLQLLNYL